MEKVSKSILFATITVASLGGIYFGLFSCGGYVWHKQLFSVVFTVLLFLFVVFPPHKLKRINKRLPLFLLLIALFFVVRAAASAYYPAPPESIAEFFNEFLRGLIYGPC